MVSSYWTNFAKAGNPNGPGLPEWPGYNKKDRYAVMHLQVGNTGGGERVSGVSEGMPYAAPDVLRPRYELLDRIAHERAQKQERDALKR